MVQAGGPGRCSIGVNALSVEAPPLATVLDSAIRDEARSYRVGGLDNLFPTLSTTVIHGGAPSG